MAEPISRQDIQFGGPAIYRIVVQGVVGESWRDRLAGLEISMFDRGPLAPHTVLAGPIRDQAELRGVIETLHGLHLPIVRVEQVTDEVGDDGDPATNDGERT